MENNDENLSVFEAKHKIYILGTAHVSKKSAQETKELIEKIKPKYVAVELDQARYDNILENDASKRFKNLNINEVLKSGKAFLFLVQLVLSTFQRRLAKKQGIQAGEEMKQAILTANELGIPILLVDRPVDVTLKRAWNFISFWEKMKIISMLLSFPFDKTEISAQEIEKLKEKDGLGALMEELAKDVPNVKRILLDERDEFISYYLNEKKDGQIVAILGAGHVNGVIENLKALKTDSKKINVQELLLIPPKKFAFWKIFAYLIPLLIIALFIIGFLNKGFDFTLDNIYYWTLVNAIPAGLMALFLGSHPLTILVSLLAPIFSLIPLIGTGLVAGLVEAYFRRPQVKDFETIGEDLEHFKTLRKNKVIKILLIMFLVNLASAIGSIVGFKYLLNVFS